MRRLLGSLGALLLVGVIVVGPLPTPAHAGPLDPVIPLPYTPSQLASVLTGYADSSAISKAYTAAYLIAYNAARNGGASSAAAAATAIASTPKPITAPGALARGATPLVAFQGGWAIGQGGIALYAAATGTTYQDVICSTTPEWYQAVNSFIMLSLPPACTGSVVVPNGDKAGVATFSSGAVFTQGVASFGSYTVPFACGPGPTVLPGTQYYQALVAGSSPENWISSGHTPSYGYGCGSNGDRKYLIVEGQSYMTGKTFSSFQLYDPARPAGSRVVETATVVKPNPTRSLGCTITSTGGQTYTALGGGYNEAAGIPLRTVSDACRNAWSAMPSGTIPNKISTHSTDELGAKTTISEQTVNAGAVPSEATPGGGGLTLSKVVGAGVQSCMDWTADCAGWWAATSQGTVTGTYRCEYQGAVVALTQCSPYQSTFETPTATPTITDPLTGTQTPWQASPSAGNALSPGVGPGTGVNPGGECFASGWAAVANPIDWVLVPVKCAFVWAFIPRAAVVTTAQTAMGAAWADTMPGQLPGIVSAALVVPGDPGGCLGPHVFIPFHDVNPSWVNFDAHPLAACEAPMSTVATAAKTFLAAILIFGTAVGIIRRASATVNAPGLGGGE